MLSNSYWDVKYKYLSEIEVTMFYLLEKFTGPSDRWNCNVGRSDATFASWGPPAGAKAKTEGCAESFLLWLY